MTVHLVKLCVGIDSVQDLRNWQARRLASLRQAGEPAELRHRTMQTPRRRDEVLDGGSLYWVIRGVILVRQRIVDLTKAAKDDGRRCCGIVLDPELVATRLHPRRAFQGWRYLEAEDAPPDAPALEDATDDMPTGMREELRELRLIDW
ncbi:MAG: DUF1489 family protein [Alphaproteobacteria bacterium]